MTGLSPLQERLVNEFTIEVFFKGPHFYFYFFPSFVLFKIRKDVEMQNLAKRYLAELIKEECWNSMAVKGRALKVTAIRYHTLAKENFHGKFHGRKIHIQESSQCTLCPFLY